MKNVKEIGAHKKNSSIFIISFIMFLFVIPFSFQVLWNDIMPYVFGLPTITFWQSMAMMGMTNLLLSGVIVNLR